MSKTALALVFLGSLAAGLLIMRGRIDETPARLTVQVTHDHNGPRSRCDECIQPGDDVHVQADGPADMMRAIFVYRNENHQIGVVNKDHLDLRVDTIGQYIVVAYQMPRSGSCLFGTHDYDHDTVIMQRCGGVVAETRFTVR